jgi:hypothetical protein
MATAKLDEFRRDTRSALRHYWILFLIAAVIMVILGPVAAQPFTEIAGGSVIGRANALAARIHAFHRWTGSTPPPASYCPTMRAGEAVMVELARLANRAIRYHQPGLALELQRAGDRLGDELDEEEAISDQAGIPYNGYPCLVVQPSYPSRAVVLALIERRVSGCRRKADAARVSFDARRALMHQCLRLA